MNRTCEYVLRWFERRNPEHIGPATRKELFSHRFDSLDVVELVLEMEDELQVSVPDHGNENLKTVADVLRWFAKHHPGPRGL